MFIAATSECLRTPLGVPYHSEHVGLDHPTAVGGLPESEWNEVSTETR